jgi:hypothetical protein
VEILEIFRRRPSYIDSKGGHRTGTWLLSNSEMPPGVFHLSSLIFRWLDPPEAFVSTAILRSYRWIIYEPFATIYN